MLIFKAKTSAKLSTSRVELPDTNRSEGCQSCGVGFEILDLRVSIVSNSDPTLQLKNFVSHNSGKLFFNYFSHCCFVNFAIETYRCINYKNTFS